MYVRHRSNLFLLIRAGPRKALLPSFITIVFDVLGFMLFLTTCLEVGGDGSWVSQDQFDQSKNASRKGLFPRPDSIGGRKSRRNEAILPENFPLVAI